LHLPQPYQQPYDAVLDDIYKKKSGIVLPKDHIVVDKVEEDARFDYDNSIGIPDDLIGVDIGKNTVLEFSKKIGEAKTIFWNGPMGIFEIIQSSFGTRKIAEAIAENKNAFSIVGGGDTIAAINKFKIKGFGFVSTGGGASLDYIRLKGKLPGIVVLE